MTALTCFFGERVRSYSENRRLYINTFLGKNVFCNFLADHLLLSVKSQVYVYLSRKVKKVKKEEKTKKKNVMAVNEVLVLLMLLNKNHKNILLNLEYIAHKILFLNCVSTVSDCTELHGTCVLAKNNESIVLILI